MFVSLVVMSVAFGALQDTQHQLQSAHCSSSLTCYLHLHLGVTALMLAMRLEDVTVRASYASERIRFRVLQGTVL